MRSRSRPPRPEGRTPGQGPDALVFGTPKLDAAGDLARLSAAAFAEGGFDAPWSGSYFAEELERERTRAFAAHDPEGVCVGYILGWRVVDEFDLLSVTVDSRWRRLGVAGRLFAHSLGALQEEGVRRVTLEVRENNVAARALYEGQGFALEGRRPRYYAGSLDALLYGRAL